jgi:hypothetical protein
VKVGERTENPIGDYGLLVKTAGGDRRQRLEREPLKKKGEMNADLIRRGSVDGGVGEGAGQRSKGFEDEI